MVIVAEDAKRELARRAKIELAKRRQLPEFKENVIRALRSELFDKQLAVLDDPSPRIAICCSRRAGKSELAARLIAIALLRCKHNDVVMFAARTLLRARQIIFGLLEKINEDYGLGWRCSPHIGQIITPDGGVFMLLGVDDVNGVEKVRGSRFRLAVCDEASTYDHLLERLVIDILEPGTMDFDPRGRIILTGTPGYSRTGYWFEAATGQKPGWKTYHWTIDDNPHIPNVKQALKDILAANGWSEDEPTYLREYRGVWTVNDSTLVYSAVEGRNTCSVDELPKPPPGMSFEAWVVQDWMVTVAADIGFTDAFAVIALGSPPHSRQMYVLEVFAASGLRAEEQAAHIHEFRIKYRPRRTVVDVGNAGGKLVQQEFNFRYGKTAGGPAVAAKKMGKIESIGMFNSDMRVGLVKAVMPASAPVFKEWTALPWATDDKDLEHPKFDNHCADAVRYAWREHCSFLAKPAPKPKTEEDLERERVERRLAEARKGRR